MKRYKVSLMREQDGKRLVRSTELVGLINAATCFSMAHFACDPLNDKSVMDNARMRAEMRYAEIGQRFSIRDNLDRWQIEIERTR